METIEHDGGPPPEPADRRRVVRVTAAGSSALTMAILPVFLVGAATDAIRADLGVDEAAVGAAVTLLFVSAAVLATPAGHLAERIGAGAALRLGVTLAMLATAVTGVVAQSWWQLAVPLLPVGLAIGFVDTGAARAFTDGIPRQVHGLAFGIKEAAVPSASLLAGLALPTLAAWWGWRAMFVAAVPLGMVVLLLLPAGRRDQARPSPVPATTGAMTTRLAQLAAGVGLGSGSATAAATFLVPATTARGLSASVAGLVLVAASVTSIGARVATGWWADRGGAVPSRTIAAMLTVGASGSAVLALDGPVGVGLVASLLVLGGGWGWTGLAFLAGVRARPDAPAAAAGIVLTGLAAGGAVGPVAFGTLVTRASYTTAWWVTTAALVLAAVITATSARRGRPRHGSASSP